MIRSIQFALAWMAIFQVTVCGQTPPQLPLAGQQPSTNTQNATQLPNPMDRLRPTYVLRPGDQILIRAFEMEEIGTQPYRIDGDGYISLPQLGRIKAGGVTVEALEATLIESMKKFVLRPQVTVTVVQFSSEPIFFEGAFKEPGIHPLQGRRTLVEMMSSVGGLTPTASRRIKITRRKEFGDIPLPNAVTSPDGSVSTVEIKMASLRDNVNPAEDIVLQPFDVISVERAENVYVNGQVIRVGAFELQERDSMSVIQALTLAGGLGPNADPKTAWILRPVKNTSRRAEIPLNLEKILQGKESDRPLLANDVLYVPKQPTMKRAFGHAYLIVIPMISTALSLIVYATR
jgi:polysaccharide export outer membrane protein